MGGGPLAFGEIEPNLGWPWVKPIDNNPLISLFIKAEALNSKRLQFVELDGSETLSQLTPWTLTFDSTEKNLDGDKLAGAEVGILFAAESLKKSEKYQKAFTGVLWDIYKPIGEYKNPNDDNKTYYRYRATVVPKVYFLNYHVDSRIFMGKKVQEILGSILKDEHGLKENDDFVLNLEGLATTFQIPVCIQYQENDWTFIQRLLMKAGIYFYVEHTCTQKGDIKHVIHFTDKKPTLAKAAEPETLKEPRYEGKVDYGTEWVGFYNWSASDHSMMLQATVDSFHPTKPSQQALLSQQKVDRMGNPISKHSNYGSYYPQQGYSETTEGEKLAKVRASQYNVFQHQAQVSSNIPTLNVMQKFTVTDANFAQAYGATAGNYLIYKITFNLSLSAAEVSLSPAGRRFYRLPSFMMNIIPLNDKTPVPCSYFELPPAPVTQTKLQCVVANAQGKYDDAATKEANRVTTKDNLRNPYVVFPWDQATRTLKQSDLTPVPVQYYAPPGLANLPMIGSWALVEFLAFDQTPIFIGVQYHKENEPFKLQDEAAEMVLMAQHAKSSDNENVNYIALQDGTQLDIEKKKQLLLMHAPAAFKLLAAQGSKDAPANFSIDEQGNITLGNKKASITLKNNGDIVIENANVNLTLNAEGAFIVKAKNNVDIDANNIALKAKALFTSETEGNMSLKAKNLVADTQLINLRSTSNIIFNAHGEVSSI